MQEDLQEVRVRVGQVVGDDDHGLVCHAREMLDAQEGRVVLQDSFART